MNDWLKAALARTWRLPLRVDRADLAVLLGLAVIAVLIAAFLVLADAVGEGSTMAFDQSVLLAFRTPGHPEIPLGPLWLQEMARDITSLGSFAVLGLIFIAAVGYLLLSKRQPLAIVVAVSVIGGVVLSQGLKAGYDRPRPELGASVHIFTASFPSGHAMLSAVTYLTLGAMLTRTAPSGRLKAFVVLFAIALTLLVGLSRLYLGVHYPTDVLAGWCLGSAWAALCLLVLTWFEKTSGTPL